jgi:tetratricopeptide (TPR) repeat protein
LSGEKPREVSVLEAGLKLLADDAEPARRLENELRQSSDGQAPYWIGQLGWWEYLSGDYPKAVELLSEATQQRPGDTELGLQLAWATIEVRRYRDALQTLEITVYQQQTEPERAMARAVAHWQAQESDAAMLDFGVALGGEPEWGNPNWVRALYSPLVAQSVLEMQAERMRRDQRARIARSS